MFLATVFSEYHANSSLKSVVRGESLLAAGATACLRVAAGSIWEAIILASRVSFYQQLLACPTLCHP